jgi:site-specific DNA-methyltransferase (adenine-specific)
MLQGGYNDGYWDNTKGLGRWPANIIFDEEAGQVLDQQSGIRKTGAVSKEINNEAHQQINLGGGLTKVRPASEGGASRFFYCPKASKKDRNEGLDGFEDKESKTQFVQDSNEGRNMSAKYQALRPARKNTHPTVKPINLMAYLCRLITPEGGIVLDPFMGSGSTGVAAQLEGFRFVGMEQDKSYFDIASARIESYEKYKKFKK